MLGGEAESNMTTTKSWGRDHANVANASFYRKGRGKVVGVTCKGALLLRWIFFLDLHFENSFGDAGITYAIKST